MNMMLISSTLESLYKVADYYDAAELQDLCKTRFMASISPENVLTELMHPFGLHYESITNSLQEYAVKNWVSNDAAIGEY